MRGLRAWQRPTLPPLERQYHWRGGFSRPSSGWDRVFGPSLWPPGRQSVPAERPPRRAIRGLSWGRSVFRGHPRCRGGRLNRVLPLRAGGRRCRGGRSSADRAISTGQLRGLHRFHLRPIDVVVFHGSQARPGFEGGFPLRCVQRLSRPHLATRRCGWRHNRYTRGASIPVLSYWGERLASLKHPRQIGTELSHDVLNPAHVPL